MGLWDVKILVYGAGLGTKRHLTKVDSRNLYSHPVFRHAGCQPNGTVGTQKEAELPLGGFYKALCRRWRGI